MQKLTLLLVLFQLHSFPGLAGIAAASPSESDLCARDIRNIVEKKIGEIQVKISTANGQTCGKLEISQRGRKVFLDQGIGNHYFLGAKLLAGDPHFLFNLTGMGKQLVISKWTGGAHCCDSLFVFELGAELRKIAEIEGGNFEPEIVDLKHDGRSEIIVTDDFLAYRFSSFAESAKGKVILKFSNGDFVPADEYMRRKPPSGSSWQNHVTSWRKSLKESGPERLPESFVQALTDLVFTGNEHLARPFVDKVWPEGIPGKIAFLKEYKEALADSRYYSKAAKDFDANEERAGKSKD